MFDQTQATQDLLKPITPYVTLTLHTDKDDFVGELSATEYAVVEWIRDVLPESKWLGNKDYTKHLLYWIGATDTTALILSSCWPEDQLLFGDEIARLKFEFLLKRFASYERRAMIQADYKLRGIEGPLPVGWIDHPDLPLSKCQKTAVSFALGHEGTALFMDRGTGKSATSINIICNYAKRSTKSMLRVLIVCPNQVRSNWQREIMRFATVKGKVAIIKGTREKRTRTFVQSAIPEDGCLFSAMIVGYDTLASDDSLYTRRRMWDLVITDESHAYKSSSTARWKSMLKIRDLSSIRRLILTGSPIGNSIMDLWAQLEFCGRGLSGFSKFGEFRKFHGDYVPVGEDGIMKLVGIKNVALLQERLARVAFSVTKAEAGLDLPDKVQDVHEVQMTARQEKIYNEMAKELYLELEDQLSGDVSPITINNVLTKLMRLAQVTSGFITFDAQYDPDTEVCITPKRIQQIDAQNPKIEAVREMLLEADPKAKTVIWACFVEDIEQICALLKEMGIKHGHFYGATSDKSREEYELAFNLDPDFKVLVCNAQSAGEGLNLVGYDVNDPDRFDTYCDHAIFYSCNWSSIQRGQAEDRIHRRGTRMPVRITDLVVPDSMDEEIRMRIKTSQANAMSVTDIRNILETL